jgi:hypothetical protein
LNPGREQCTENYSCLVIPKTQWVNTERKDYGKHYHILSVKRSSKSVFYQVGKNKYQNLCVLHDEKLSVFNLNCKMWRTKSNNCILQNKCCITKKDQIVSATSTIMHSHITLPTEDWRYVSHIIIQWNLKLFSYQHLSLKNTKN